MGGLGDVCLSESLFASVSSHFKGKILALGVRNYLKMFQSQFEAVDDIGSLKYLFLFSDEEVDASFESVIFIGKDRDGLFRKRLRRLAKGDFIFIDMYPERERVHVEEYQLRQLKEFGVEPKRKELTLRLSPHVVLYPERQKVKRKWEYENYIQLKERLETQGIKTIILGHERIEIFGENQIVIEDLGQMREFLEEKGGIFVSSDGGCAHLACASGLFTLTLFFETDPIIWHPRRNNVFLTPRDGKISVEEVESTLLELYFRFFPNR